MEGPVVVWAHTAEPSVTNKTRSESERRSQEEMNDALGLTGRENIKGCISLS